MSYYKYGKTTKTMKQEHFDTLLWRVHDYHPEIIKRVVYSIPDLIIQNPESTYADLAMGGGQFLQGVLNRCVELGQSKEQVLPRLYGYERAILYRNYARWENSLQGANLVILNPERVLDSLAMKFDVIVGNPPYQAQKSSNGAKNAYPLWKRFILKAQELLKDEGCISLLVPSQVAKFHEEGKPSPALQKTSSLCVTSVFTGMERFFNVGSEISLITFTKGQQTDTILVNGNVWDWKSRPWVPTSTLLSHLSLLDKLFKPITRIQFVHQHHQKEFTVNVNHSIGCWGMNRGKDYGMMDLSLVNKRTVHMMVAEFESRKEQQAALLLFSSPVYRFLKKMLMFGSDVSHKTVSALPVPEGWQSINSVEEATSLFGLTEEELHLIGSLT